MPNSTSYIVVDIETDGSDPTQNSMLNLAAVALDQEARELATFSVNLKPLETASPDPGTLAWWQSQPDAWDWITHDPQPPDQAIERFAAFVRQFPGQRLFVGHPLIFDGMWVSHYMQRFLGQGLMAFHGVDDPLFFGAGIDLPSFVSGALALDYAHCRHGRYPRDIAADTPHTHIGLDDARGHAEVLRNTLRALNQKGESLPGGTR